MLNLEMTKKAIGKSIQLNIKCLKEKTTLKEEMAF